MRLIDRKTNGGMVKGKIAFYCNVLCVTQQGFYGYFKHRDESWKYEGIAENDIDYINMDYLEAILV